MQGCLETRGSPTRGQRKRREELGSGVLSLGAPSPAWEVGLVQSPAQGPLLTGSRQFLELPVSSSHSSVSLWGLGQDPDMVITFLKSPLPLELAPHHPAGAYPGLLTP